MAELKFDSIATAIGDADVVSFACFVSEPLTEETEDGTEYCLVLNSWFDHKLWVNEKHVVASIPGNGREHLKSLVWIEANAPVRQEKANEDNDGTTDRRFGVAKLDDSKAGDVARDVGVQEAMQTAGTASPPAKRQPP